MTPSRNGGLDGLRGYAALAVLFWHVILSVEWTVGSALLGKKLVDLSGYDFAHKLALTLVSGGAAVQVFFILSGAVLMDSLKRDRSSFWGMAWRFVVRRIFRIYPVLLLTIGLMAIFLALDDKAVGAREILKNVMLYDAGVVGPSWTLNVEAFAVILLLIGFAAYRRFDEVGILVAVGVLALIAHVPLKGYMLTAKPYIYCFTIGMLVPTSWGRWLAERFPVLGVPLALVVLIFAQHTVSGGLRTMALIAETAGGILVLMLYYHRGGVIGRFLARPSSVFLGSISYSLYLLNVPFILLTGKITATSHPLEIGIVTSFAVSAAVMPLAYWSLVYVEKPGIELGRRLTLPPLTARAAEAP